MGVRSAARYTYGCARRSRDGFLGTRFVSPFTAPTTELLGCLASDVFRRSQRREPAAPVLLIPGLGMPAGSLAVMWWWLERQGHLVGGAGTAPMIGCSEELTEMALASCAALANDHGDRVVVIGHSRGGQLARVVAGRRPDLVSGVVTLGTPGTRRGLHPGLLLSARAMVTLGRFGLPGMPRHDCFAGSGCCAEFTAQLKDAVPERPMRVVWSPRDEVVPRHALLRAFDPRDEREVDASHTGMLANAAVYREIAAALRDFARAGAGSRGVVTGTTAAGAGRPRRASCESG